MRTLETRKLHNNYFDEVVARPQKPFWNFKMFEFIRVWNLLKRIFITRPPISQLVTFVRRLNPIETHPKATLRKIEIEFIHEA